LHDTLKTTCKLLKTRSGRRDLNSGPLAPQPSGGLTGLHTSDIVDSHSYRIDYSRDFEVINSPRSGSMH
jgi:hypothetical protein